MTPDSRRTGQESSPGLRGFLIGLRFASFSRLPLSAFSQRTLGCASSVVLCPVIVVLASSPKLTWKKRHVSVIEMSFLTLEIG